MSTQSKAARLRKIFIIIFMGLAALIIALQFYQAEWKKSAKTDLRFTETSLPFSHSFNAKTMLPFLGSAAFDANSDFVDELFLGGGIGQPDTVFTFTGKGFIPLHTIEKPSQVVTHGAAHLDYDEDGDVDLFAARNDGIWLYENKDDTFKPRKLDLPLAENTTPLSIALGDVNKDGFVDLFISGYIKVELVKGQTVFTGDYGGYSHLFVNNGDNTWHDATREAGLWRQHNTFTAVFADIDNDMNMDLITAQDTGVIETFRNRGDGTFTPVKNPSVSSFPMGVGVGDYNNDGLVDIFASNVGHTMPSALLRNDLPKDAAFNPEYYLLKNTGSGFTDVATSSGLNRTGFGWGSVIADMDLDGKPDLLASQNYARLPGNAIMYRYPGKVMLQQDDGVFLPAEKKTGAINKAFGITPLISDFNNDGRPDIVWANLDGRSKAYIATGIERRGVKVVLPNQTRFLGARVRVTDKDGNTQTQQLVAGEGLGSDQSRTLIFGLGNVPFKSAKITLIDGTYRTFTKAENGRVRWTR